MTHGKVISKTAEPAKKWGLTTLSQGDRKLRKKHSSLLRRVDRAVCPHFFAQSTQLGVFIPIVARLPGKGTPVCAAPPNLATLWSRDLRQRSPTLDVFESGPASLPTPTRYQSPTVREGTLKETWKPN